MNKSVKSVTVITERALQRRVKRHLIGAEQGFYASCAMGLERVLKKEIAGLEGAADLVAVPGGVEFRGPLDLVYEANLQLGCANRVMMRISTFIARSYPELFGKLKRIPWEQYVGYAGTFYVDASGKKSRLHHTDRIADAAKDAIVACLKDHGLHPRNSDDARIRFFIRFYDDHCTVNIDTSGELLHKRGYRQETGKAPLRESIASSLLHLSRWETYPVVADPFCGSGTFPIECALLAGRVPPGHQRDFAFFEWPAFSPAKWERAKRKAQEEEPRKMPRIVASDNMTGAIRITKSNALRAGVLAQLEVSQQDCCTFNSESDLGPKGLVVSNLPYGKRVAEEGDLKKLYKRFGNHIREVCKGWGFGFVVPEGNLKRHLGLTFARKTSFHNGGLQVEFVQGKIPG